MEFQDNGLNYKINNSGLEDYAKKPRKETKKKLSLLKKFFRNLTGIPQIVKDIS